MRKERSFFEFQVFEHQNELPEEDRELLRMAVLAKSKAYAPYSQFKVGAALALENGMVVTGNNQENACYPSGLCAERVAIYYAGASHPGEPINTIAIAVSSEKQENTPPAAPCGNCRQAISEYETRQGTPIRILMIGDGDKVIQCNSISDLLPLAFNNSFLG